MSKQKHWGRLPASDDVIDELRGGSVLYPSQVDGLQMEVQRG